jgi:molybdopterin converting factor small subunit
VVEGFCAGLHRSPHKGFSVDFKQHRQYVPGDDVRYLDGLDTKVDDGLTVSIIPAVAGG